MIFSVGMNRALQTGVQSAAEIADPEMLVDV
jgi:hypothetical protein